MRTKQQQRRHDERQQRNRRISDALMAEHRNYMPMFDTKERKFNYQRDMPPLPDIRVPEQGMSTKDAINMSMREFYGYQEEPAKELTELDKLYAERNQLLSKMFYLEYCEEYVALGRQVNEMEKRIDQMKAQQKETSNE